MPQLQALIFDVDGTLAETERDGHRVAFNQAFQEAGLSWNWTETLYGELLTVSGGKERIRYFIETYQPDDLETDKLSDFIIKLHQQKTQYYRQLLAQGSIPLRRGVQRLITEAREQGIKLAIATTSALPNALALIEKHLNPDWFTVIAAGDMVENKKPAPDLYNYALDKLGLTPDTCLAIEDSEQGAEAAFQANLKTVVTVNNYTKDQHFKQANLVLDSLGNPEQQAHILRGKIDDFSYFNVNGAQQILDS
ncbi:HAD-IA family hydrolase [Spirulina sp. CS-785/01]|uniref:HAD-IA family hydrolase n=1 Tax=Spirulina sp. CS-785/01 TaxID=3021716 RepID=UPI00232C0780|nr:HAD-IA family hydrolase [Spirulina sp. CS-785/01]MDB9314047.1 HAD-IA family hydrolase [Spirulina sp. CS-785/01]